MTTYQIKCLDAYEKELRPNLPPLDRTVELEINVLDQRLHEMQDLFVFSNWPKDKIYAAAIIYLVTFGYDPEEEERFSKWLQEVTTK